MSQWNHFLGYTESHRAAVCAAAATLLGLIGWADWRLPTMSIGFLYLLPILLSAATLNGLQIMVLAGLCSFLQEAFSPERWSAGAVDRLIVTGIGFAMTGFFVSELNQRRRRLTKHLGELESEMRLRQDAEAQLRTIIETSPLAILTIESSGRVLLANESAHDMLSFDDGTLHGADVAPLLPILP